MSTSPEHELRETTDAQVWAVEFMRLFENRREEIDTGLMISWFANAIETGRRLPGLNADQYQHYLLLTDALNLYIEKDTIRGSMWRQMPPSDKIRELRERVGRIEYAYENREKVYPPIQGTDFPQSSFEKAIFEDALDIINYCIFLIRQIREGATG